MLKFLKYKIISFFYFLISLIEKYEYKNISLDEDDFNKKIINSLNDLNIKVLSDTGYVNASSIHITQPYKIWEIILENGYRLECADIHILFDENYNEVYTKDLMIGSLLQTDIGLSRVKSIKVYNQSVSMFDLSIDHDNHRYYTNGILSHNTVNAAITMLHFITFNNDKNIMIVANMAGTTIEIIDKIKSIYINLPFFLKVGVKNWSQRTMIFENGCRIKSAARSKTPAIGFTIDFLYLDEFAHIPSNIIEPYYQAVYPVVSAVENSKIVITSTPNGMNLFHKLLIDAERVDGDPLKNKFNPMRVYWYQVEGRFVTYYRLYESKLHSYNMTKEELYEQASEAFKDITKTEMSWWVDLEKDVICVYNNTNCPESLTKSFQFISKEGLSVPIQSVADVSTWKDDAIRNIGGEDAFNQEYELRFINSSRSLLNESIVEGLIANKKEYKFEQIHELDRRLKFSYSDLKFVDDDSIFMPIQRKSIRGIMSIDISEGLGQDYSVLNLFKIEKKPDEIIEQQKHQYTHISDFFCLVQFGLFRSNLVSVKQLAEIIYVLLFEYFNPDNFKAVIEINSYGNELLAYLPNVFEGNNNYGSNIFFKYKHRSDAVEEKIGIKINDNKNLLVKDYQDSMDFNRFVINNEINIKEITTFVKHITSSGNIKYASDSGNDDCVMTLVDASSIFSKYEYREMVDLYANQFISKDQLSYFNKILSNSDYTENVDYSSVININRQRKFMKQYKNLNPGNFWGIK